MAIDTDRIREELESDTWGARELQSQLRKTLNEIDRLRKQLKSYPDYEKRG